MVRVPKLIPSLTIKMTFLALPFQFPVTDEAPVVHPTPTVPAKIDPNAPVLRKSRREKFDMATHFRAMLL